MAGLLSRERIIAKPGFNRWLVPPAALAIHLSIGMAYGFSVFWLPLSRSIGITKPAPGDWKISTLGWMFTLFFVFLGSSAALFGAWLERVISPLTVFIGFKSDLDLPGFIAQSQLKPISIEKVNIPRIWSLVTCVKPEN